MQAIKEKLNDMGTMRKAKAEAKEEEKAEKELAKARVEVAHEVRLAREAEAAMDLHVNKAAEKVAQHEAKQPQNLTGQLSGEGTTTDSYGHGASNLGHSTNQAYGGATQDHSDRNWSGPGTGHPTAGGPTTHNLL